MFEREKTFNQLSIHHSFYFTRESLELEYLNTRTPHTRTRRYCQASKRGGHTHFSRAKIKLKPKEGDLLVFSYLHDDGTNDYTRLSMHSGCPIREGEKIIATQWFRNDVSELKNWIAYREESGEDDST